MTLSTSNRQIARAAVTVMAAYVISTLVGLVRLVLMANTFGTSTDMDGFVAANRVSETLFNLVAGGALGSAFIPVFAGLLTLEKRHQAWRLASAIGNLILLVLTTICALAAIFAPQIVTFILAPGFSSDPAKVELTTNLLRIMLPSVVLFGLSGLVMGILNSYQIFLIPALAPSMYSLGIIFGIIFLAPSLGIYGLAYGALIGAALHLLIQVPVLLRQHGQYTASLALDMPEVREVGRLLVPRLIGVAFVQLNFWVNIRLASYMAPGSVNALLYAFALLLAPIAIIAQAIAVAALPTFSRQVARGEIDEMRNSLVASLRGVLLLAVPAGFALLLLRQPLTALFYQRGEFTADSTELVAWALLWYAVGLVGFSMVEVLTRAFYAMHDTLTPVAIGVGAVLVNILLSLAFTALFERLGWFPHGGLALANSLATTLEMLGLILIMRKKLHGLNDRSILTGFLQATFASVVMGIALAGWLWISAGLPTWLVMSVGVLTGLLVYGGMGLLLRVNEVRVGLQLGLRRLRA